jgi:hypothetical protein
MMWLQNNLEKKTNNEIFNVDIMLKFFINNQRTEKPWWKKKFGKIIYKNTQGCTHEEILISWNWIQQLKKKHKPKTYKRNKKPKVKNFENKKKQKLE